MEILEKLEKSPLQSKKFIGYLLSNMGSKILLFWMISQKTQEVVLMTMIIASAFLDVGYVLGQAALDKYVRVASMKGIDS